MLRVHSAIGQVRKRCLFQMGTHLGRKTVLLYELESDTSVSWAQGMTGKKWTGFYTPLIHSARYCTVITLHSHIFFFEILFDRNRGNKQGKGQGEAGTPAEQGQSQDLSIRTCGDDLS